MPAVSVEEQGRGNAGEKEKHMDTEYRAIWALAFSCVWDRDLRGLL